jgi:hypothetical protein
MEPTPKLKTPYWKSTQKIANYAITGQDSQSGFQNLHATANITLTLPKAFPGLYFKFLVAVNHQITVTPKITTDTIRGKAAGASAVNSTIGSFLSLICLVPGFWEPEINIGGW